jgi:hypothetical protein
MHTCRLTSIAESYLRTHTWNSARDRSRAEMVGGRTRPIQHDEPRNVTSPRQNGLSSPHSNSASFTSPQTDTLYTTQHSQSAPSRGPLTTGAHATPERASASQRVYLDVENKGTPRKSITPMTNGKGASTSSNVHTVGTAEGASHSHAGVLDHADGRQGLGENSSNPMLKTQPLMPNSAGVSSLADGGEAYRDRDSSSTSSSSPLKHIQSKQPPATNSNSSNDMSSPTKRGKPPAILTGYSHSPRVYGGSSKVPNGHYKPVPSPVTSPNKLTTSPMGDKLEVPNTYSPRTAVISPSKEASTHVSAPTSQRTSNANLSSVTTPRALSLSSRLGLAGSDDSFTRVSLSVSPHPCLYYLFFCMPGLLLLLLLLLRHTQMQSL